MELYDSPPFGKHWVYLSASPMGKLIFYDPLAWLAHAYALAGKRSQAQLLLDEAKELSKQRYLSPYDIAIVYAGLGQKDQAFAWLQKAYEQRCDFMVWLKVDPRFGNLRADPRFQDLVRRVGFPP
jgi:tetratricopeptide (TPR) repeat protein